MNLFTGSSIPWDGTEDRFHVGFMINSTEHPDCISNTNLDGSFVVNYSPKHTSMPINDPYAIAPVKDYLHQPPNTNHNSIDPAEQAIPITQSRSPAEQTTLRSMTSPRADSPWSERDGQPPPYSVVPRGILAHEQDGNALVLIASP